LSKKAETSNAILAQYCPNKPTYLKFGAQELLEEVLVTTHHQQRLAISKRGSSPPSVTPLRVRSIASNLPLAGLSEVPRGAANRPNLDVVHLFDESIGRRLS
jgi:hypothetical protein